MTDKTFTRRQAMLAIGALSSATWLPAAAQTAGGQVQIVVPVGPGGLNDFLARLLAERMAPLLQRPVIAVNKPGANGNIAATFVAKASADGDTLLLGTSQMAGSATLYKSLPYSLQRDLVPVALLARTPYFLAVRADLPVRTAGELVALARSKPNTLSFASTGVGSGGHLLGEAFSQRADLKMTHVPFNSAGQYTTEMMAGRVDLVFAGLPIIQTQVNQGKLRILGVTLPARTPLAPEVPTMAEAGGPAMEDAAWFGLFAPAGTSAEVVEKLGRMAHAIVNDKAVSARLVGMGALPQTAGPREFAELIRHDIKDKAAIITAAGVRLD